MGNRLRYSEQPSRFRAATNSSKCARVSGRSRRLTTISPNRNASCQVRILSARSPLLTTPARHRDGNFNRAQSVSGLASGSQM